MTTAREFPPSARERDLPTVLHDERAGTGLGLSLVQKIVVTHNGRIHVAASSAGGASIQVVLPLRKDVSVHSIPKLFSIVAHYDSVISALPPESSSDVPFRNRPP